LSELVEAGSAILADLMEQFLECSSSANGGVQRNRGPGAVCRYLLTQPSHYQCEAAKRPNSGIDEYWWGVPPMNIEDSRIIARFQGLLTESLVASRLGQWRPELKDALYQMMFEALAQRDLKKTPEYRNVMLRADQHAEWLAGLARLCTPDVALPISSKETERAGTPTALEKAA
jgi:hypothetical protein